MTSKTTYQSYFKRQLILAEFGEKAQQKLQKANIVIVGCGGLGSAVAVYLAASGVGALHLIDFDEVAVSNLHRQVFYTTASVGKPKATVLAAHIKQLAPFTKLSTSTNAVIKTNVLELVEKADLIIDCTDSLPTKYLLNDACVLKDKPLVYGSLYKFDGYVASFNVVLKTGERSANLRDAFPKMATNIPNCSEAGTLNPIVGIIALFQVNEAIKILSNLGEMITNKLLIYNALSNEQLKILIKPQFTKEHIADIFEKENYKDEKCIVQDPRLLISFKELQTTNAIIVSVIEDIQTPLPFDVFEQVPFSTFEAWLQITKLFQNDRAVVFVCNKGISSYQATLLASKQFPKANIFSLKNGIQNS